MMLDKIINLVKPFAPVIAGALSLAGPLGVGAGALLKQALLGNDKASDEDLLQAVQNITPEQTLALKRVENDFTVQMRQLDVEDKESARTRETDLAKAGVKDRTPAYLAYFLTFGVFAALAYLFLNTVPNENKELIVSLISALVTVWVGAMGYYHGSTSSSKDKDKFIEAIKK